MQIYHSLSGIFNNRLTVNTLVGSQVYKFKDLLNETLINEEIEDITEDMFQYDASFFNQFSCQPKKPSINLELVDNPWPSLF